MARRTRGSPADGPCGSCSRAERTLQELLEKRLLRTGAGGERSGRDGAGAYALTDAGELSLHALTETGEQRLRDLLAVWRRQENPDLARLIGHLAREFWIDTSTLRAAAREAPAASAP